MKEPQLPNLFSAVPHVTPFPCRSGKPRGFFWYTYTDNSCVVVSDMLAQKKGSVSLKRGAWIPGRSSGSLGRFFFLHEVENKVTFDI